MNCINIVSRWRMAKETVLANLGRILMGWRRVVEEVKEECGQSVGESIPFLRLPLSVEGCHLVFWYGHSHFSNASVALKVYNYDYSASTYEDKSDKITRNFEMTIAQVEAIAKALPFIDASAIRNMVEEYLSQS